MAPTPVSESAEPIWSGPLAAAVVQMAAQLVEAVARASPDWDDAAGVTPQAAALGRRAAALGELDARVYARARERLAAGGDDGALGDALAAAADAPLAIARTAADAADLAALAAAGAEPATRPDAAGAALLSAAAAESAAHLVSINLGTRAGDERVQRARELVADARAAADRALAASS